MTIRLHHHRMCIIKKDTSQEEPSVKEPQEKAEDLSEDANEVTESEKRRDKEMEENFEESVENLE